MTEPIIPPGYFMEHGLRVKYEAAWTPEAGEVTVIRSIYAGVSGPDGTYPAESLAEAEAALFAAGLLVAGEWQQTRYGQHWVRLTSFKA